MKRKHYLYSWLLFAAIFGGACWYGSMAPDIVHSIHQVELATASHDGLQFVDMSSHNVTPVALHEPIFALSKWHFGFPKTKNSFFGGRLIGRFGEIRGPPSA